MFWESMEGLQEKKQTLHSSFVHPSVDSKTRPIGQLQQRQLMIQEAALWLPQNPPLHSRRLCSLKIGMKTNVKLNNAQKLP